MQTALFTNFSDEVYIGYWNGKGKKFEPGQSLYMPDYLARHYAKHLTNRELLKKGLEKDTSPKVKIRPDGTEYVDNIVFTEMFNKAYTPDEDIQPEKMKDEIDVQIEVANKNRGNTEVSSNVEPLMSPSELSKLEDDGQGVITLNVDEDESEFETN